VGLTCASHSRGNGIICKELLFDHFFLRGWNIFGLSFAFLTSN
jgi:hypothetical protein